jgi:hypothetical protein
MSTVEKAAKAVLAPRGVEFSPSDVLVGEAPAGFLNMALDAFAAKMADTLTAQEAQEAGEAGNTPAEPYSAGDILTVLDSDTQENNGSQWALVELPTGQRMLVSAIPIKRVPTLSGEAPSRSESKSFGYGNASFNMGEHPATGEKITAQVNMYTSNPDCTAKKAAAPKRVASWANKLG